MDVPPAVRAFKEAAIRIYGARVRRVVLFGSSARGEATADSDTDILLVLSGAVRPFEELDKLADDIFEIGLKYDALLSVMPVSEQDYLHRQAPYLINAREEGITA